MEAPRLSETALCDPGKRRNWPATGQHRRQGGLPSLTLVLGGLRNMVLCPLGSVMTAKQEMRPGPQENIPVRTRLERQLWVECACPQEGGVHTLNLPSQVEI